MDSVKTKVRIPKNHHLQLELDVPLSVPVGEAEMLVVFAPTAKHPESTDDPYLAGSSMPALKGSVKYHGDITAPLNADWNATA